MPNLDVSEVAKAFFDAILPILKKGGGSMAQLAKQEAKEFADTFAKIAKAVAAGNMTKAVALDLIKAQKTVSQMTLETVAGMTKKIVQDALNAGLNAVKGKVNAALPFALL
jgi:hypothetical protein